MNANNVDRPTVVTIAFAKMETLKNMKGEAADKLVLYFSDHKQNLALNGVNFDSIVEISGQRDSDHWPDTRIEVYRTTTEMAGKTKPCIRVQAPQEMPLRKPAKAATPAPKSAAKPSAKEEMDDEFE
jgi:hypothetical protein